MDPVLLQTPHPRPLGFVKMTTPGVPAEVTRAVLQAAGGESLGALQHTKALTLLHRDARPLQFRFSQYVMVNGPAATAAAYVARRKLVMNFILEVVAILFWKS